jgi:periplasmic protein TonB
MMKFYVVLIAILFAGCATHQQNTNNNQAEQVHEIEAESVVREAELDLDATRNSMMNNSKKTDTTQSEIDPPISEKATCLVKYTINVDGTTKDHELINCSHPSFANAALESAKSFRYQPETVDGVAVEVKGVLYQFTFVPAGSPQ